MLLLQVHCQRPAAPQLHQQRIQVEQQPFGVAGLENTSPQAIETWLHCCSPLA
jgi:hypothetical protein